MTEESTPNIFDSEEYTDDYPPNTTTELDEDDEGEPITAQKVLESLQNAWLNEQMAPEILPHQTDLLDLMLGQIVHMEENISNLNKNDFRYIAHKMELDRIRYIIGRYLRFRLKKIENFTAQILQEESVRPEKRLSNEELRFATEYANSTKEYFHKIALRHMPPNLQENNAKEIVKPNLMTHVFLKSNVTVSSIVIGANQEEVDLMAGSQHIMPYQLIADLIIDGRAQLI